eukprot:6194196-Pleurochrysis_carterae.AAC.4
MRSSRSQASAIKDQAHNGVEPDDSRRVLACPLEQVLVVAAGGCGQWTCLPRGPGPQVSAGRSSLSLGALYAYGMSPNLTSSIPD